MKLLSALKRQPADNCIILTYNLDLLFFEHMLFEPLYAAGCRNTLVLCDPLQYQTALADVEQLRYAGQRYLLMPARTSLSGAFHPKLILLTSADNGRLFLTSGNLTKAGYTRNLEIVSLFEYNPKKPDPTAWAAIKWGFDTLSQIAAASDADGLAQQRLEQLIGTTPWLRREAPLPSSAPVWSLHNLDAPLLDQAIDRYRRDDGSPVSEALVISPFFDSEARAIGQLLAQCQPRRLRLYTQADTHGLNPRALAAVLERHQPEFHPFQLNLEGRTLHAKALLLRTGQGAWLVTGSANFSQRAWLQPAARGNTEFVSLRFEPDPTYFDPWLEQAIVHAHPLELDWEAEPLPLEPPVEPEAQLTLLSAILVGHRLVLRLADPLPARASLTLHLTGDEARAVVYEHWEQSADGELSLLLEPKLLSHLQGPTLVNLSSSLPSGELDSNQVLLLNLDALRRYSRPVERPDRPRIPAGMLPESYEHCVQLLEMLHDLLATNTEQLRRHRRRIAALSKADQQEKQMAVEEEGEYDPEEHFVEERVEAAVSASGADLYVDFYDRLTYQELLRAALAAVYRPLPELTEEGEFSAPTPDVVPGVESESGQASTIPTVREPIQLPDDATLRARFLARIQSGFKRLVGNFVQGAGDAEYLAEVPPQYLIELFVILTTYLRVVWRDSTLDWKPFVDHSFDLLTAFWGQPGQPGAWQALRPCLSDEVLAYQEERLALGAQTWLHVYVAADLLDQSGDRRIYDLAAWTRYFGGLYASPEKLGALSDEVYRRLWRFSMPLKTELRPASEVVNNLRDLGQRYDDESLLAEIATWPGARARIRYKDNLADLNQVSTLTATFPLGEADWDRCWQTFLIFLACPNPKRYAWARFTNTNPVTGDDDVESITIFFREDEQSLLFAVKRASGDYRPEIYETGVAREYLCSLTCVAELQGL